MKINAYCLDWHISDSGAFADLLVDPLKPQIDIKLTAWDGESLPRASQKENVAIFCMLPPTQKWLKQYGGRVVWIPMWDQALGYSDDWWSALPKNVHVVAFSNVIYKKALGAGLSVLRLKYYKNPSNFRRVSWDNGKVIFYWNRVGLVNEGFLRALCRSVGAYQLLFRSLIDPRIDKNMEYTLPSKLGNTKVVNIRASSRESYLKKIEPANIFISPRAREGVGMTFLEAMARGCAVIANNEPTMNEYIVQGKNGLLLDYSGDSRTSSLIGMFRKNNSVAKTLAHELLAENQNWRKIRTLDFHKLGDNARIDSQRGYDNWQKSIAKYAKFLLS